MSRELIIYCDESDIAGKHFSNFYGGLLVESAHLCEVLQRIKDKKAELNLFAEVKWQKITEQYAEKYIALVDEIFALVAEGKVKIRIMFTQNYFAATGLSAEQHENAFFILYYQFVKNAFGLRYSTESAEKIGVRLYFDNLPDTAEKCSAFRGFVCGLNNWHGFSNAGVTILQDQIAEVDSKDHVLLQCLDVVLGSMQFRLNDKHKDKPIGARRRGKRTIAKERVYKHINARIRGLHSGFNIGISTGTGGDVTNRWAQPYRHWLFVSEKREIRPQFRKKRKKK